MKRIFNVLIALSLIIIINACGSKKLQNSIKETNIKTDDNSISANNLGENKNLSQSAPTYLKIENLSDLQKSGLEIIEKQSFEVNFEDWGKVKFISGEFPYGGTYKLRFYLADYMGRVLYTFPEFYGNQWSTVYELKAISFKDINSDGLKDIIILADYMTGVGPDGATPFPVGSIYFQQKKSFINLPEFDQQLNNSKKNETIDMIVKFAVDMEIKLK